MFISGTMMKLILLIIVIFFYAQQVSAGNCYHCISSDSQLEPTIRRHLKTQSDVFFWQVGMHWNACSSTVDPNNPAIEAQICSKYDLCVTLQPNVNGSSFVIRGCLENVLRHSWREDFRLHKEGCYMIRSMPTYPNRISLDYVICICREDYCNYHHMTDYVVGDFDLAHDSVLNLIRVNDNELAPNQSDRLNISSPAGVVSTILLFIILGLY